MTKPLKLNSVSSRRRPQTWDPKNDEKQQETKKG